MLKRIALILGAVVMAGCSNHDAVVQTTQTAKPLMANVGQHFESSPTVEFLSIMADAKYMSPMDKHNEPLYRMDVAVKYSIAPEAAPLLMKEHAIYHEVDEKNHIALMKRYMSQQLKLATYTAVHSYELHLIVANRAEFHTDILNVLKRQIASEPWAKQLNVEQVMITNMVFSPPQPARVEQRAPWANPWAMVLF